MANSHYLPTHKWKIDIPEEISVELDCTGKLKGNSGSQRSNISVLFNLKLSLGDKERDILVKGEPIAKPVSVEVRREEGNKVLWPNVSGGKSKITAKFTDKGEEIEIKIGEWENGAVTLFTDFKVGGFKDTFIYCTNTGLAQGKNKIFLREERGRSRKSYWGADRPIPLEGTVSIGLCVPLEGATEATCTLKVVT